MSYRKILHVVHGYFPEGSGGIQVYVRDVLREQRQRGLEARLLTSSEDPWETCGVERIEVDGMEVLRLHRDDLFFDHYAKAYHPGVEELFGTILASEKPDLVHVHQWLRLTCNLVEIADRCGVPAVVTLHDLYTSCPRCYRVRPDGEACFRDLSIASCEGCVPRFGHERASEVRTGIELFAEQYRRELALARVVLVATAATADLLSRATGVPRDRYELLPLGYEPRFDRVRAPRAPAEGEPLRVAYWGTINQRKGVDVLLEAMARIDGCVDLHLFGVIDTEVLRRQIDALIADSRAEVTLHGRYEWSDIADIEPHVAVFPSSCFETFGIVLDECFELGLPCVVTDIGALPERAREAALVVPPRDAGALAAAIDRLANEPETYARLAASVPPTAPSVQRHVEALSEVYARAIATPPTRGVPRFSPQRWAAFLLEQRESAQSRICPEGGPR